MAEREYECFLKCSNSLADLLQHQVVSISSQLLEGQLISKDLHDWVLTVQGVSNKEKTARLLSCVADQIKASSTKYDAFLDILKRELCFEDAVRMLATCMTSDEYGEARDEACNRKDISQDIVKSAVECGVVMRMKKLDCRFRSLHGNILSELESKRISVRKVLNSLTLLPIELRQEYVRIISEKLPDLRREEEISDLFLHLNPLVSFIDYGLIQHVIDQFGSNTLKKLMSEYSEDVLQFMKETTVKQLMDHWPGQQIIPPDFKKLEGKIDEDPTAYSLYQLDKKRKQFCCEVRLTEVVLVLIGLRMSTSFVVEWLLPSTLVPQLVESARKLDFGFYLRERMLWMAVSEEQIFPVLQVSRAKNPTTTEQASMVRAIKTGEKTESFDTSFSSSVELAATLPSSMKLLSLSQLGQHKAQWIKAELDDSSLYSGVGVLCDFFRLSSWRTLSTINFKSFHLGQQDDLKKCLSTIAQSNAYPKPTAVSGSQPFVIAVFIAGERGPFPGSLFVTSRGSVDIVDDIIKPFLPQSAPHLIHIPKLFFVSSWFLQKDLDTQPPSFPDIDYANYCIAYHLTQEMSDQRLWMNSISEGILSSKAVLDVIEESQSHLDKDSERLYTFSCLKDNVVLGK